MRGHETFWKPSAMPRTSRLTAVSLLCMALAGLALGGSARAADPAPVRLRVVGMSDLKSKTSPCGCSTPKGGFARMATYLDSLRLGRDPVVFVDGGGSFPDVVGRPDLPPFVMRSLVAMGVDAVGVGPRDLQFGLAYLLTEARRSGAPWTCANLVERATGKPVLPPSRIVERGGVKVGLFALIGDRLDLGPARDSLQVLDPENTAQRIVADLRGRGAQVIVMLGYLGRVGTEDIAAAVPGIDIGIVGYEAPYFPNGRPVGDGVLCYAGEQGQHLGVAEVELDANGRVTARTAEVRTLGPDVRTQPAMAEQVRAFEDTYNERMRLEQRRMQALADADPDQDPVDHYVGGEVCARCHAPEAAQWRTTAHSVAWETLVRERKDATPECIPCHSVGYGEAGGFRDAMRTPHLVNVQCENCHGMGTLHDRQGAERTPVGEATCKRCHNAERDPAFDYAARIQEVVHSNTSGVSLRNIEARRRGGAYGVGH